MQWWTFLAAITVLTIAPGADTMIVLRNTLRGGFKDGLVSSLGISLGLFVHATLSAVGISAILLYSATAFTVLKILGALYLLYLAFGSFKNAWNAKKIDSNSLHVKSKEFRFFRSLQEGFLSNVLNPKAVIFYMAFLPQFINPNASALSQSLLLASVHFILSNIWQAILVLMIISANRLIIRPSIRQKLDIMSGLMMGFLGVRLLLEKR
jgi:threonine/homoserine/homoserine lactone efflux protein